MGPVTAEMWLADRRTDRTKIIYPSRNSANAPKGTRIVQADSGSDSDSESRRQSAQSVQCRQIQVPTPTPIPRVGASRRKAYSAGRFRFRLRIRESAPVGVKSVLCLTVQVRIVVAGSGGSVQTESDGLPEWFPHSCSESRNRCRNLNLFALYALRRLSESESEPESACTIRVP
jgi:hypothetical protein